MTVVWRAAPMAERTVVEMADRWDLQTVVRTAALTAAPTADQSGRRWAAPMVGSKAGRSVG